jgi:hypothetical protein
MQTSDENIFLNTQSHFMYYNSSRQAEGSRTWQFYITKENCAQFSPEIITENC